MSASFWKFGRSDYLALRLALAIPVIATSLTVLATLRDWLTGRRLVFIAGTSETGPATQEPLRGAVGEHSPLVRWTLSDARWWEWTALLVPQLLALGAALWLVVLLWRLVSQVKAGDPFEASAVKRIRTVGAVLLMYGIIAPFVRAAAAMILVWGRQDRPTIVFQPELWSVWPCMVGVLVLLVGEAFARGSQLRADVEGLV